MGNEREINGYDLFEEETVTAPDPEPVEEPDDEDDDGTG